MINFGQNAIEINMDNLELQNDFRHIIISEGLFPIKLPKKSEVGQEIEIHVGVENAVFRIITNKGQKIRFGKYFVIMGEHQALESSLKHDWLNIVCIVPDKIFLVMAAMGNFKNIKLERNKK